MVDMKTAISALRSDAEIWDGAATDLDAPMSAIGSLGLTGHDVSMYGVDKGIDTTYTGAQTALEDMLRQAAENFSDLAGALRQAADMYDQTEADHQQRIQSAGGN
ncbi:Excreted virulence factor EspC, type VII ESX diderm [Amycolatopsis marina]|uniref:Excreted virulence factor EspC, type VII ESX diderm n=1 Tax=Amycolatopsis marina TaxID=490629 RepID=A0A1I1BZM7_9PSEU|nr:type VII secretion target [Amycolatopsis marina]SFB55721.1 Excreted virulence factor EspC, type VII ESX diderm [Amycolatopsis marina]